MLSSISAIFGLILHIKGWKLMYTKSRLTRSEFLRWVEPATKVCWSEERRFLQCWIFVAFIVMLAALMVHPWDHNIVEAVRLYSTVGEKNMLPDLVGLFRGFGKGEIIVFLALLLGLCGLRQGAVAIIAALVISSLVVIPLKVTVKRERPRGNSFVSFPSGDAASAAAFVLPLVAEAPIAIPVAVAVVVTVGAGRVLVFAHYPSDVLAGIAFGLAAGALGFSFSRHCIRSTCFGHYLLLVTLFLAGDILLISMGSTPAELSRFMGIFGPLLCVGVVGRFLYVHITVTKKNKSSSTSGYHVSTFLKRLIMSQYDF